MSENRYRKIWGGGLIAFSLVVLVVAYLGVTDQCSSFAPVSGYLQILSVALLSPGLNCFHKSIRLNAGVLVGIASGVVLISLVLLYYCSLQHTERWVIETILSVLIAILFTIAQWADEKIAK